MSTSSILVVGFGGIGAITAYNLEAGGLATVTAVLRSNYTIVREQGIKIDSVDYGSIISWRPTHSELWLRAIRRTYACLYSQSPVSRFDFIVVCTKNTPDIPPTVADIIAPAVTPGHTAIVLIQNGINVEKPIIAHFPSNVVISGVSRMSVLEPSRGVVHQPGHDHLIVGAFRNHDLPIEEERAAAIKFCSLYQASGKATVEYEEDVAFIRWRKLVYNVSFNSLCAITGMDCSSIKVARSPITELILPVMLEIKSIARAAGVKLAPDQEEISLAADPLDRHFKPSMQQDIEKGNFMEIETIVGEPVREAQRLGVPAPTLTTIYALLRALQERIKQQKRMGDIPRS
ncbi:hypothetical protein P170DRAFT_450385 [Aspergillus steynii IBT 23096]|uniref:2-dehydropantoate 2-reductase n=1 Tax=Aspergillus steynii IBT 23096 TaxID=1392250 RepID=A0A2I2FU87_9EURO|nr:uncharacterized protein P170DRAFT_450385 [Aspergillus steynii IBT 23096]PLB44210.1 hypothetical protein P170DRAFT_450385 [Aspergillus steynii IBT 23096]